MNPEELEEWEQKLIDAYGGAQFPVLSGLEFLKDYWQHKRDDNYGTNQNSNDNQASGTSEEVSKNDEGDFELV